MKNSYQSSSIKKVQARSDSSNRETSFKSASEECNDPGLRKNKLFIQIASLLILAVSFSSLFSGCYANPNLDDMDRVKKQFLVLRFQAVNNPEYQRKSDRELFEESCKLNRVSCGRLLILLKQNDTEFYTKLLESSAPVKSQQLPL